MLTPRRREWKAVIIFFTQDSSSHINPIVPLMKECDRRNFRAILMTPAPMEYQDDMRLRSLGIETDHCFVPREAAAAFTGNRREMKLKELYALIRHKPTKNLENLLRPSGPLARYMYLLQSIHTQIEDRLQAYKPDLIVVDHNIVIPCLMTVAPRWMRFTSTFPSTIVSSYNTNCVPGLGLKLEEMTPSKRRYVELLRKNIRKEARKFAWFYGVQNWPSAIEFCPPSPYLNIYLSVLEIGFEKVLAFKPIYQDWIKVEHTIDKSLIAPFLMPSKLANRPGKLILLSLGSLASGDYTLMDRIIKMLSDSPYRFIISLGTHWRRLEEILTPNMWGAQEVQQRSILPHIDLLITNGGHNAIIEAFYFGVPGMILMPVFADQFDAAQRVEDCGFGIRMNPYKCNQTELANNIESILANVELKDRMSIVRDRMQESPSHKIVVDKIETLLESLPYLRLNG